MDGGSTALIRTNTSISYRRACFNIVHIADKNISAHVHAQSHTHTNTTDESFFSSFEFNHASDWMNQIFMWSKNDCNYNLHPKQMKCVEKMVVDSIFQCLPTKQTTTKTTTENVMSAFASCCLVVSLRAIMHFYFHWIDSKRHDAPNVAHNRNVYEILIYLDTTGRIIEEIFSFRFHWEKKCYHQLYWTIVGQTENCWWHLPHDWQINTIWRTNKQT